ncbi:hypothetical protein Bcep1808_7522 (plasmid) [Burkholderia vietnamiensis G4]|uniref:Uncharacterized protein n=1 Tax=Burkholderia vietnamiensis (strain G4 / LMG 22486) TaxID=269482 RepID=A4JVU4_BURVG|nr:hypothetical protein Bcep1808_7522 [Burkholderia vietnamiensis G4]
MSGTVGRKIKMTKIIRGRPISRAGVKKFVSSPANWLNVAVTSLLLKLVWDIEAEAIVALTPSWFVPVGLAIAAAGIIVSALTIEPKVGEVLSLAMLVFLPGVLYVSMKASGSGAPASAQAVVAIVLLVGSWGVAIATWIDCAMRRLDRPVANREI